MLRNLNIHLFGDTDSVTLLGSGIFASL